ncbi:hypothetical protein AAIB33_16380 [Microbacterium sp. AZCO]|uniref:hypothetical protein n=1 Tax=Microbacterium sp. AZCO TaxID=3142976 RepID=UPI0031F406BC
MIPIVIHVDRATLAQLERIAERRGSTPRDVIVSHLRASLDPTRPIRVNTTRSTTTHDVDEWERLARAGVTNNAIADRFGVSKSLVSRYLLERGVRRKRRTVTTPSSSADPHNQGGFSL